MKPNDRTVVVQINSYAETFASFEALEQRAASLRQAILDIETESLSVDPRDPTAWLQVERLATDLLAVLTAMERWLARDDEQLQTEIDAAFRAIREI